MRVPVFLAFFSLAICAGFSDGWTGTWHRNGLNDSAELVITAAGPGKFHFVISAYSGAHIGEIEGDAIVKGESARWAAKEDEMEHEVGFLRTTAGVTVTSTNCEGYYGGAGVSFDGTYGASVVPDESLADERLSRLVEDAGIAEKMKASLGPSFVYVVSCLHLVADPDNLDGFSATVISGCVVGICQEMAAIVMFTPAGHFYVGWVENGEVFYLSSDSAYKRQLPKTIEEWAKQFESVKLIFK